MFSWGDNEFGQLGWGSEGGEPSNPQPRHVRAVHGRVVRCVSYYVFYMYYVHCVFVCVCGVWDGLGCGMELLAGAIRVLDCGGAAMHMAAASATNAVLLSWLTYVTSGGI